MERPRRRVRKRPQQPHEQPVYVQPAVVAARGLAGATRRAADNFAAAAAATAHATAAATTARQCLLGAPVGPQPPPEPGRDALRRPQPLVHLPRVDGVEGCELAHRRRRRGKAASADSPPRCRCGLGFGFANLVLQKGLASAFCGFLLVLLPSTCAGLSREAARGALRNHRQFCAKVAQVLCNERARKGSFVIVVGSRLAVFAVFVVAIAVRLRGCEVWQRVVVRVLCLLARVVTLHAFSLQGHRAVVCTVPWLQRPGRRQLALQRSNEPGEWLCSTRGVRARRFARSRPRGTPPCQQPPHVYFGPAVRRCPSLGLCRCPA